VILLLIAGTLNIIYGFGAIGNAHFFTSSTSYTLANLHTWGWITVILGLIQLTAGVLLLGGNAYGRIIGIIGAALGALEALAGGGNHPLLIAGSVRAVPVDPARTRDLRRGRESGARCPVTKYQLSCSRGAQRIKQESELPPA
jgi:hypothetical protein